MQPEELCSPETIRVSKTTRRRQHTYVGRSFGDGRKREDPTRGLTAAEIKAYSQPSKGEREAEAAEKRIFAEIGRKNRAEARRAKEKKFRAYPVRLGTPIAE